MKEELLLEHLKTMCPGRARIQTYSQLMRALGVSRNELGKLIHRLRVRGEPVASCRKGCYYALDASEVYSTILILRQMIAGLEMAVKGLEAALKKFSRGGGASG